MIKRKHRLFIKIFILLLIIQLILIGAHVVLANADSSLSEITAVLISVISIPIRIINPDLPFYSGEGIYFRLIFWILNLILQTLVIYGLIRMIKRLK